MIKNLSLFVIAALLLAACGQRNSQNLEVDMEEAEVGELQISSETMNEIIQNIASPIEVAALINSMNVPFPLYTWLIQKASQPIPPVLIWHTASERSVQTWVT